jgi:hypothetical protein
MGIDDFKEHKNPLDFDVAPLAKRILFEYHALVLKMHQCVNISTHELPITWS